MSLFTRVLYATDFSPLAEFALKFLKTLKATGTREIVVVHVVDKLSVDLPEGVDLLDDKSVIDVLPLDDREYIMSVKDNIDAVKTLLLKDGFDVTCFLVTGRPGDEIVKIADKEDVDIIIIGAHGKSLLTELLIGSVSADVIRRAFCPVLIIKGRGK